MLPTTTLLLLFLVAAVATLAGARPDSAVSSSTTTTTTTESAPPVPFKYAFASGRAPGGNPDRYVEQEGDDKGVVKGSYAYLDPNWKWQKVKYVADDAGFHILEGSSPSASEDTPAVAAAKARHAALFAQIAARHQKGSGSAANPGGDPATAAVEPNQETDAVKQKRQEHAETFARIAQEHARIAAEQARISSLAEAFGEIYE